MIRLIPRETKFFDMFREVSSNLTEGANLLLHMLRHHQEIPSAVEKFRTIEHKGDDMTHSILTKLNQTFITPFDREDIHKLASTIDDVLDFIYAAGERLVMYKISQVPPEAAALADVVVKQAEQLAQAVSHLEKHDHVL